MRAFVPIKKIHAINVVNSHRHIDLHVQLNLWAVDIFLFHVSVREQMW
jgi:hypothetical protein